jgi:hypothetical protein
MEVERSQFPSILPENEETYIKLLLRTLDIVDTSSSVVLCMMPNGIRVRISPSTPSNFFKILKEVEKFHTLLNIRVEFYKSMKLGSNISYLININQWQE